MRLLASLSVRECSPPEKRVQRSTYNRSEASRRSGLTPIAQETSESKPGEIRYLKSLRESIHLDVH